MSYHNKYHRVSVRHKWLDYSSAGLYFITICTQSRQHYFGEIYNGTMHLSDIGHIVQQEWLKTFDIRPDMNLTLDEFVVMPNHFHAIMGIGKNQYNHHSIDDAVIMDGIKNKFGPQIKNLASIVRGFKSSVTSRARSIHAEFKWQRGFHDHIIRSEEAYQKIGEYIINNPERWREDLFYK